MDRDERLDIDVGRNDCRQVILSVCCEDYQGRCRYDRIRILGEQVTSDMPDRCADERQDHM